MSVFFSSSPSRRWWRVGAVCLGLTPLAQANDAVLQEVSVTATRDAQEMRRNATAGKIIVDRKELDTLDASSVGELLRKLPGTGLFADPDTGSRAPRGHSPSRNMPQIVVDGQALPGGPAALGTALRFPVELIERVEIIRNSTPEFPSVGSGGVINLILRDTPPSRTLAAKLGLGASQGRTNARLEGQAGDNLGAFSYLLSGSLTQRPSSGNRTTDETQYASQGEGQVHEVAHSHGQDGNATFSPRLNWKLGEYGQLTLSPFLSYSRLTRTSAVDSQGSGTASSSHEDSHQRDVRSSGRLMAEWKLATPQLGETSVRLMAQGEREQSDRHAQRQDNQGTRASQDTTLRHEREWLASLRHKKAWGEDHLVTSALEWRTRASDDRQDSSGTRASTSRAQTSEQQKVFWIQDEWQLAEQHVLTPGLRWQLDHTEVDDGQSTLRRAHQGWLPSLHYLWQVDTQWNLRASASRNNRAPSIRELSPVVRIASGENSASNPDRAGNANLRGETLRVLEVGIEHFLPARAGTIGLSLFERRIDDYSQRLTLLEGERWVERPFNLGQARSRGLLLDAKAKLDSLGLPKLTARANLSLSRTQVEGSILGDGPRKGGNVGLDYETPYTGLTLGGLFSYTSALDRDSSLTVRQQQDARRQLDLYATYKIDRQLTVRASAQNVTGEKARNQVWEYDSTGALKRQEVESRRANRSFLLTLEGKW